MINRVPRKELKKQFAKTNFRLPETATVLAQQYNFKPVSPWQRWRTQVVLLCLLAVIFILTYSGLFKIKNIIVDNVSSPTAQAAIRDIVADIMSHNRLLILPQSNLALFSPGAARKILNEKLLISDIDVDKHWPNVLRIRVNENLIVGTLNTAGGYYLVDKRGVVINQVVDITLESGTVEIINRNSNGVNIGDTVFSSEMAQFIQTLVSDWYKAGNLPNIKAIEYITAELPKIFVLTSNGWQAYVSYREPVPEQINALSLLLAEPGLADQSRIEYIDARFGTKVFYKLR